MKCGCRLAGKRVLGLPTGLQPHFLSGLSNTDLDHILSTATHRQFAARSLITYEQDPAERFFILLSGQGRVFVHTSDGDKILLHWLTPGQIFGFGAAMPMFPHYLVSTDVSLDSCALVWDRKSIRQLVSQYPRLLENALSIAATERFAWYLASHVSLNTDDATGRIAHILISSASAIGKVRAGGVEVPIGNEDLASMAHVTPFTVSRILKKWQHEGVLTKRRGKVVLRKPELLITRSKATKV